MIDIAIVDWDMVASYRAVREHLLPSRARIFVYCEPSEFDMDFAKQGRYIMYAGDNEKAMADLTDFMPFDTIIVNRDRDYGINSSLAKLSAGFRFSKYLKSQGVNKDTPFGVLTSKATPESIEGILSGADFVYDKETSRLYRAPGVILPWDSLL